MHTASPEYRRPNDRAASKPVLLALIEDARMELVRLTTQASLWHLCTKKHNHLLEELFRAKQACERDDILEALEILARCR